ncbi:polyprenyl synthetase family protein [soil metagenome]
MTPTGSPLPSERSGLVSFLAQERARVDRALGEIAAEVRLGTHNSFAEPMYYALSTAGKRLRPILCAAAFRAVSGASGSSDWSGGSDRLYRLSCAVEVVHTYSLVHDDLPAMDDDDLRRGRATLHRVFGVQRAVMAGAALISLAIRVILTESHHIGLAESEPALLVKELCTAAGAEGMVGGQYLDLLGEGKFVDAVGLESIHRAKTGALLVASLRIGARAAGGLPEQIDSVTRYGRCLGLAFQIVDDILDVTGNRSELGKTPGRDEDLQKSSYPSLYGLERSQAMARVQIDLAKSSLDVAAPAELLALADYVVERVH